MRLALVALAGAVVCTLAVGKMIPAPALVGMWAITTVVTAGFAARRVWRRRRRAAIAARHEADVRALDARASAWLQTVPVPAGAQVELCVHPVHGAVLWALQGEGAARVDMAPWLDAAARAEMEDLHQAYGAVAARMREDHPELGQETHRFLRTREGEVAGRWQEAVALISDDIAALLERTPALVRVRHDGRRADILFAHAPLPVMETEEARAAILGAIDARLDEAAVQVGPLGRPFAPPWVIYWPDRETWKETPAG